MIELFNEGYSMEHPELTDIKIIHACIERGIKLQVSLIESPRNFLINYISSKTDALDYYEYIGDTSGFYRCTLYGLITLTGVIEQNYITAIFSIFQKTKSMAVLENLFPEFNVYYNAAQYQN